MTSNAAAHGRFSKDDFIYIAGDDEYQCPAGQRAIHRFAREEDGLLIHIYWTSACPSCPIKRQCTTSSLKDQALGARRDHRSGRTAPGPQAGNDEATQEHRGARVRNTQALDGLGALLTRGSGNVATEMSLNVRAYNMKRVISLVGMARSMKAMRLAGA
uniref:hypothetical protein n=1 Tax=Variovorax gracilis TaxID=3053502 RepID=UPI00336BDD25